VICKCRYDENEENRRMEREEKPRERFEELRGE
jgi:hypothetical protein